MVEAPIRDTWEEDDAFDPPMRSPAAAPSAPKVPPPSDELPDPGRPGAVDKRPFWRDPVVVIGATVPALILVAFVVYLFMDRAEKAFEGQVVGLKTEADNLARSGRSQLAVEKYDQILSMIRDKGMGAGRYHKIVASSEGARERLRALMKADLDRLEQQRLAAAEKEKLAAEESAREAEKAFHLSPEEIPEAAEIYIKSHIIGVCEGLDTTEEASVQAVKIEPAAGDWRKIPWLWYATANVAVTLKPEKPGFAPKHMAMAWIVLFQFTPDCDGGECWREVTMTLDGSRSRRHFDLSEWTPEFRATAVARWQPEFQKYSAEISRGRSPGREERVVILQKYKDTVANELGITTEELDEILAAPGPLPQVAATTGASMAKAPSQTRLPAAPQAPPRPPTVEEQILAEYKRTWAQAQRTARTKNRNHAVEYLRARKQEILTELATKYKVARKDVKAIVPP